MLRCIELANRGAGNVALNPMVGAILVWEDRIIGEGWHQQFGKPHAEVNCINSVKAEDKYLIPRSTLFVSLEPCNHYGKTPPCSQLIVDQKIPKVIIGCKDSFHKVNGTGIEYLKENGVQVEVGILKDKCLALNKIFFTNQNAKRPYIVLKWAESQDRIIGSGNNVVIKISNDYTRRWVHKLRSELDGILVGYNTWKFDKPALNNRYYYGKQPVRFVISNEEIEGVKSLSKTQIIAAQQCDKLMELFGVSSVLIEGGSDTFQFFIDNNLWDEAYQIISNITIGKGTKAPQLINHKLLDQLELSTDTIKHFVSEHNNFY